MRLSEKTILCQATPVSAPASSAATITPRRPMTGCLRPEHLLPTCQALRAATNPRQLRQEIYTQRNQLLDLPLADPQHTEDVYQTLLSAGATAGRYEPHQRPCADGPFRPNLTKGAGSPVTLSFDRTITLR